MFGSLMGCRKNIVEFGNNMIKRRNHVFKHQHLSKNFILILLCCSYSMLGQFFIMPVFAGIAAKAADFSLNQSVQQCAYDLPVGWNKAQTLWTGSCTQGLAQNFGAIVEMDELSSAVHRAFLGVLANGKILSGVIDTDDGFICVYRQSQKLAICDNEETYVNGFEIAIAGARQAIGYFKVAGQKQLQTIFENKLDLLLYENPP